MVQLLPRSFGWCCLLLIYHCGCCALLLLHNAVLLIGFWVVLKTNQFGNVKDILVSLVLLGCVVLLLVRCVVLLRSFVLVVVIVFEICDGTPLSGAAFPLGSVVWC